MKRILLCLSTLSLLSCSTTKTSPDGTITVTSADPKTIKIIAGVVGAAAASAATYELESQAAKQNQVQQ